MLNEEGFDSKKSFSQMYMNSMSNQKSLICHLIMLLLFGEEVQES